MKITKVTLSDGKIRLYEGSAFMTQYTIKAFKLDVVNVEEFDAVTLIGFGPVPAVPASELKIGDVVGFNYGHRMTVTAITELSPAFLAVTMYGETGGRVQDAAGKWIPQVGYYTRRNKKTAMIPLMRPF